MDEIGFRNWLKDSNKNKKVQGDIVSRLKTLQRELGYCDLDVEYEKDRCKNIFDALDNKGENDIMKTYGSVKLPIGQFSLSVYRYALRTYIKYLES